MEQIFYDCGRKNFAHYDLLFSDIRPMTMFMLKNESKNANKQLQWRFFDNLFPCCA